MGRICGIFLVFRNKQTKAARRQILKLEPLKLVPSDVQVLRTPVDQEELCIKLLIPGVKTNEEAEKAVNKSGTIPSESHWKPSRTKISRLQSNEFDSPETTAQNTLLCCGGFFVHTAEN